MSFMHRELASLLRNSAGTVNICHVVTTASAHIAILNLQNTSFRGTVQVDFVRVRFTRKGAQVNILPSLITYMIYMLLLYLRLAVGTLRRG